MAATLVAFDSNVLTYFLDAASGEYDPSADPDRLLVDEKVAAYRLFLWCAPLAMMPTVERELERIRRVDARREHLNWIWYHFEEMPDHQQERLRAIIQARTAALLAYHRDRDDCRLLAECEAAQTISVLVTCDARFRQRLQSQTSIRLLSPTRAWEHCAIPAGTTPEIAPRWDNPLAKAGWWRW